jgi:hypothetical protein
MKQFFILLVLVAGCFVVSSCQHWVGISSNELVKRLGQPVNIVPAGDLSVYTYFDGLGGSPMRFYIDKSGIVRKWDATPVSVEFGTADDTTVVPTTN